MMSIYEKETKEFIEIATDALMNYARYDLVKDCKTESEFNIFAAEMVQLMESR